MASADGSVIIDTKIDTSSITKIGPEIQKQFKDLAQRAKQLSREINSALKAVEADGMVEEINGAFDEIEREVENVGEPIQEELDSIDASDLDEEISEPIEKGFEDAEQSSSKHSKEIQEDLDNIGAESQNTGGILGGSLAQGFMKVAKAIAGAAIVKELIDIGKQAIEIASDLQEVQNVVDVTFTTMSDQVNNFAKSAATSAGLSERMAKQYVGTFGAMATSFGFAEAEAFEMSTALTQLSGDLASFYNISQDEAMGKLKGIFTGETEALKELGVVMTQTELDAYAMEKGFGKTTSAMTEQEKVTLRYQFVMDRLSAASGDFVRTQDSWANQTKVLALQWEEFMGVLGEILITAILPVVQAVNENMVPALSGLAELFEFLMKILEPVFVIITDLVLPALGLLGEGLSWIFKPANDAIDSLEGTADAAEDVADSTHEAIDEFRRYNRKQFELARYTKDAIQAQDALSGSIVNVGDGAKTAEESAGYYITAMRHLYETDMGGHLTGLAFGFDMISFAATQAAAATEVYANVAQQELTKETVFRLNELVQAYETAHTAAVESINSQIGLFDVLATKSEMTAGQIVENWGAQSDAFLNYADNIQTAIDMGLNEELVAQLSDGSEQSMLILDELVNSTTTTVDEINAAYEGLKESKDVAGDAMLLLNDEIKTQMDELINIVTEKCEVIPNSFSKAVEAAQWYIDTLTGKTVYIDVVARTLFGGNNPNNFGGNSWLPVPELATGAVIPPNAPFVAILGDQKHGTNIEAPLDTMRKAFAEEASKIGGGSVDVVVTFDGDLAQLGRLLNPVIRVEEQRRGDNLAKVVTE